MELTIVVMQHSRFIPNSVTSQILYYHSLRASRGMGKSTALLHTIVHVLMPTFSGAAAWPDAVVLPKVLWPNTP